MRIQRQDTMDVGASLGVAGDVDAEYKLRTVTKALMKPCADLLAHVRGEALVVVLSFVDRRRREVETERVWNTETIRCDGEAIELTSVVGLRPFGDHLVIGWNVGRKGGRGLRHA